MRVDIPIRGVELPNPLDQQIKYKKELNTSNI